MPAPAILIREVSAEDCLPIRHAVLWPDLPPAHCLLPDDATAIHLGAEVAGRLVGVASLCPLGAHRYQLRKFAVLAAHQGQGVGRAILSHALDALRARAARELTLDARLGATAFYARFGLRPAGEVFTKHGLPYQRMSLPLLA
ncbi:MAG: GNAT family N-acetyltransferase [Candidatus Dactylopiibacterium sp.]|nr:GNAT family N-acetyltransferase [Candidatus Dactylopiibacterium sp.]